MAPACRLDQFRSQRCAVGDNRQCPYRAGELLCRVRGRYAAQGRSDNPHGLSDEQVEVLSETRQVFMDGLTLYESRSDKAYSLTDCIAMNAMKKRGIIDVLTHDTHFTQEGFHILL